MGIFTLYYWVWGMSAEGKPAVAGPYESEGQAKGETGDLEDKRLFKLRTRNMAAAKRHIKAKLLKTTGKSGPSLRPMFARPKDEMEGESQGQQPNRVFIE